MVYTEQQTYYCHNKLCEHTFSKTTFNGEAPFSCICPKCGFLTGKLSYWLTDDEKEKLQQMVKEQTDV